MTLPGLIEAATARRDDTSYTPVLFDPRRHEERAELEALLRRPCITVVDAMPSLLEELVRARAARDALPSSEIAKGVDAILAGSPPELFGTWVHYPWLGRLVHTLPKALHREVRLDRNRYKITAGEQERLLSLRIGIAGLSVGRAVASTLVREGIGGHFRLADFDAMSLSNLNRVEGTLADVGLNKSVLAARQIAELDPWIVVELRPEGVKADALDAFLEGLDVLIDECDDLAMKVALRERARERRIPVVMATSDRGMLDIERFDLDPERPIFHGLFEGIERADLGRLTTKQKVPYVMRILDGRRIEPRMAASLVEVNETISTWPQLASSVVLGGAMVANAVRRMALGELSCSGRFYADLDAIVAEGSSVDVRPERPFRPEPAHEGGAPRALGWPSRGANDALRFVATCATFAPSGSNAQPWRFEARGDTLTCFRDVKPTFMDFDYRASDLALGAALENAIIAARALGFEPRVSSPAPGGAAWSLVLEQRGEPRASKDDVELLRSRCSTRTIAPSAPLAADVLDALSEAAAPHVVAFVTGAEALARFGDVIADVDRLQFLSEKIHAEIFAELRWSRDAARATGDGLDVASLELDATDLAVLEVLRSRAAMKLLREHELGRALGNPARTAFRRSGAAAVLACHGTRREDLLSAGRSLERLWLAATARDVAIHPWGTPFLFQRLREAPDTFDAWERATLERAYAAFRKEVPLADGLTPLLVLRLSDGARPSARSLRRNFDDVFRVLGSDGK